MIYFPVGNVLYICRHCTCLLFFITPRSRFDNTLNFDITLTPNGHDCVVISLDISFYTSVAFCLHFSMSN